MVLLKRQNYVNFERKQIQKYSFVQFNQGQQKQPFRGVLRRYSENMQHVYRRTPVSKCDFNKVAKGCSVILLRIFTTPFPKKTSEGLLLVQEISYERNCMQCTTDIQQSLNLQNCGSLAVECKYLNVTLIARF